MAVCGVYNSEPTALLVYREHLDEMRTVALRVKDNQLKADQISTERPRRGQSLGLGKACSCHPWILSGGEEGDGRIRKAREATLQR